MTATRRTALLLLASLVLAFSATPLTPAVRAVGPTTWLVGHEDEALEYTEGSACADPDFWTDGSWSDGGSGDGAYNSDDDAIQDAIDNASSGDTIYVCFGRYDFDTDLHNIDPGMNLTIVGDGIGETVFDGTDSTRLINANPVGEDDDGGTLTLRDLSIEDARTASEFDNGGAVNADGLSLTRVSISGSANAYNGGALYAEGNMTIADSTFTGNDTSEFGAVLYAWNPASTVSISNSVFDGNLAGQVGGAIAAFTVTINNSTFTNNGANAGGAINVTTLTVSDSTFSNNGAPFGGGAIVADTSNVTSSTFTNNDTDSSGGAILANTATVSNSTFTNNDASNCGGAIYVDATATVNQSIFTSNSSDCGGAIYSYATGTITNSTFTNNSAPVGGAIYADATANVNRSTFSGNSAIFGGAITANSTATVSDSTFVANAASYGGAINANGSVTGSTFMNNSAIFAGGAIYAGLIAVSTSTFSDNVAVYGGAINSASTIATMSTFARNSASNSGGAIYGSDGAISRSRFTRNTAGEHGGAVVMSTPNRDALGELRGNTFVRNAAPAGGAIALGPCETPNRNEAAGVERANRFSGNRATEQRRTNNIWLWVGGCG